jgi:glycosyltransferase involved in cell wall biosynthesis
MSRTAIDELGGFDPVFGRGYGEEEDWCLRATRAGYTHRLAPRAFVFHEGGASMSAAGVLDRGKVTHEGNAAILAARFPERSRLVAEFLAKPVIHALRNQVIDAVIQHLHATRPRVIHWLHADPFSPQAGGTERVVRALVEHLASEYFQAVVFPDDTGVLRIVESANGLRHDESLPIEISSKADPLTMWRRVAREVLRIEEADLFHFHHGYRTSAAAAALSAVDADIPLVMTLHDFNLICPRNHLLDRWGAFCGVPSSVDICDACVLDHRVPMERWRRTSESALERADVAIVGDRSILDLVGRAIRLPDAAKIHVLPPPDMAGAVINPPQSVGERQPTGRVLIPGRTEAHHKGRRIIEELVARLLAHGIEVHSIGTAEHESAAGFTVHGEYHSDELDGLLRKIDPDLAIIPSIVPETFSILLTELWRAHLPVLALDAGAIAARIRRTGGGFLVSSGTAGAFANEAMALLANPESLVAARRRLGDLGALEPASATTTLEEHRKLYAKLIDERRSLPVGTEG